MFSRHFHSYKMQLLVLMKDFPTRRSSDLSLSSWKQVNGGVPQGKKLGLTLFTVMRTKYVDDTTTLEIIPRNSFSMLDVVVREIHDYCIEHKMKVNPKKCKEMYVNFMKNSITVIRPISVGNQGVSF